MNDNYNKILSLCQKHSITVGKMCTELNIRQSVLSDLKAGRTKALSTETLAKISSYFSVSIDALLDTSGEGAVSEDQIKAAFWGGDKDLSQEDMDAMWADVKKFADFVAQQKKQEKKKND